MNLRILLSAAVAVAALAAGSSALAAPDSSTASASGAVKIIEPITITWDNKNLDFGTIVKPAAGGTGTVVVDPTGSRSTTGGLAVINTSTATAPTFTIKGEGAQAYNLTIGTLTLTKGSTNLPVTLAATLDGTTVSTSGATAHTFTGALGAEASSSLKVGGTITVADTATTGAYSGSFNVTVSYN